MKLHAGHPAAQTQRKDGNNGEWKALRAALSMGACWEIVPLVACESDAARCTGACRAWASRTTSSLRLARGVRVVHFQFSSVLHVAVCVVLLR